MTACGTLRCHRPLGEFKERSVDEEVEIACGADGAERIRVLPREGRLWFVNFESIAFVQHDPEIRQMNASGQAIARNVLSLAFAGLGNDSDPDTRRTVGSHYYSLLIGLALQMLTDPDNAPTPNQILDLST